MHLFMLSLLFWNEKVMYDHSSVMDHVEKFIRCILQLSTFSKHMINNNSYRPLEMELTPWIASPRELLEGGGGGGAA